jgi:L-methionine (R)-S-oxide reductase
MQSLTRTDPADAKGVFYQELCGQLDRLLAGESNFIANAANTSAFLFDTLPDVNWVGFYLTQGEELVLGPFQGKPACSRIPFSKGVCGTAAASGNSIVVPRVDEFPGHIPCDDRSQSELVVPLMTWGKVIGVLDLDSASPNRFDEDDKEGLEALAAVFLAAQPVGDLPEFDEDEAVE